MPSAFRTASLRGPSEQWTPAASGVGGGGEQALLGTGGKENTPAIQPTPHGWLGEALLPVFLSEHSGPFGLPYRGLM